MFRTDLLVTALVASTLGTAPEPTGVRPSAAVEVGSPRGNGTTSPADGRVPAEATSTLADLVAELERNNPELAAAARDVDIRVARIAPAGALPDPTVGAGYMGGVLRPPFAPSTGTPDGFRQFFASQEIPYPGKRALRTRVAALDAEAARWSYEDLRRQLVADLKTSSIEYVYLDRRRAIVRRNKDLLEEFRHITESRFSVGKGLQQDVFKAQLEISLLIERLTLLEREGRAMEATIGALLARPPGSTVPTDLTYQAAPLAETLENLHRLSAEASAAIRRDERAIARSEQALALAKKDLRPDLAVTLTSQRFVGDMPWMLGVDVMVKVPLYSRHKQRPLIAEAAAALEGSRHSRDQTRATLAARVAQEYLATTTSRRLADLYSDSVLPQARLALESALAAYQVGSVDFLTVLTSFQTVLTYEVGYEEQVARHHQALARLEPLVGLEFIR